MSKGCLILADNTDDFDYVKLAHIAAARVERHLDIPVTVISPSLVADNTRTFPGQTGRYQWKNLGRTKAYELSPYDRTLVIDADFLINSDALLPHMQGSFDFGMIRDMYDPLTGNAFTPHLGYSTIAQMWATVMIFNKSDLAEKLFNMAEHVLENYPYYSRLYNFNPMPCHVLGGYGATDYSLKYRMVNCDFNAEILELNDDDVLIRYQKQPDRYHVQRLSSTDLHLQNKISLFGCIR